MPAEQTYLLLEMSEIILKGSKSLSKKTSKNHAQTMRTHTASVIVDNFLQFFLKIHSAVFTPFIQSETNFVTSSKMNVVDQIFIFLFFLYRTNIIHCSVVITWIDITRKPL